MSSSDNPISVNQWSSTAESPSFKKSNLQQETESHIGIIENKQFISKPVFVGNQVKNETWCIVRYFG